MGRASYRGPAPLIWPEIQEPGRTPTVQPTCGFVGRPLDPHADADLVRARIAGSAGRADGGEVAGRLVSQTSDGSDRAAEPGLRVGAFTIAIYPGPLLQNPPQPVTTAVTSSEGLFLFRGLVPGRYFISAVQPGPAVTGTWARITADQGASVLLIACTDCPVPLNGSATP